MKKRIPQKNSRTIGKHRRNKRPDLPDRLTLLSDSVLEFLAGQQEPAGIGEMIIAMNLPRHERTVIKDILAGLEKKGRVSRRGNRYQLSGDSGLIEAVVDLTSRGFGFAIVKGAASKDKDPFLAKSNLNGASHGDTVLIRLVSTAKARPEARVIKIVKRGVTRLCGIYNTDRKAGYVTPDNDKIPFTLHIRKGNDLNAPENIAVLAEIIEYGTGGAAPEGRVIEILGDPLTVSVQIRMAMEQFEMSSAFPSEVLEETEDLEPLTECGKERTDLRHIDHVTIDSETAKDFDDAVAVESAGDGFRLYISIADVSHYVRTGSAIDSEAYRRGTSVYFPDLVVPMLPERLSNDLCSLVPDQDRPAFTARLDFDSQGKRTGQQFCKSMIRSRQRFTYTTVQHILYEEDRETRAAYKSILPMLDKAKILADLLAARRRERGSIGFDIPEPEIHLENDQVADIRRAERNNAHKLIEEFMLAANEAVAETLDRRDIPVLYRVHERPDPLKVELFSEAARGMGLHLPRFELTPSWFAQVVEEARNSPTQYVISNLMLRTMQQARYSPDNLGHFGLAAEYYLHFTSPIRRYPDLVAHRVLQNMLTGSRKGKEQQPVVPDKISLDNAAQHLSKRERVSVDVERDTSARLSALYLHGRIGEEFEGIISGVSGFGFFVELLDSFISGAVPLEEMKDDYYSLDSRTHKYIGERTGKSYQMGNLLTVTLVRVDLLTKRITLAPADTGKVA